MERYLITPVDVGDVVTVWVKEVDEKKHRIGLTMRKDKL